jgi:chromosome segregation ATPase
MDQEYYKLKYFKYKAKYHKLLEQAQQGGSALNNLEIYERARQEDIKYSQQAEQARIQDQQQYFGQQTRSVQPSVKPKQSNQKFLASNPYERASQLENQANGYKAELDSIWRQQAELSVRSKYLNEEISRLQQEATSLRSQADSLYSPYANSGF